MSTSNGSQNGKQIDYASLFNKKEDSSVPIYSYIRAINRAKWLVLILIVLSILTGVYVASTMKNVYQGTTTVIIKKGTSSGPVIVNMNIQTVDSKGNEIQLLRSRSVSEEVAYKLLQIVYKNPNDKKDTMEIISGLPGDLSPVDVIAERIRAGMIINPVAQADILEIAFRANDPYEAATISRSITEVYQDRSKKSTNNVARVLRQFLESQIDQKRKMLTKSEEELQKFMETERVVSLGDEASRMIERYSQAIAQMDAANVELNAMDAARKAYDLELNALRPKLSLSSVEGTIQGYAKIFQEQIAQLEVTRDQLLSQPDVQTNQTVADKLKATEDQITKYKEKLLERWDKQVSRGPENLNNADYFQDITKRKLTIELEIIGVQSKLRAYESLSKKYDELFKESPGKNMDFARLQRNYQSFQELNSLLEKRYQEALIAEEQIPNNVEIIDWAIPGFNPVAPNRLVVIMITIVIGLALSVGLIFLLQNLDKSIYTPEEAEKLGTVLATIPVIETYDDTVRDRAAASPKAVEVNDPEYKKIASHLVTHFDPKSGVSEAYRTLRTSLLFSGLDFDSNAEKSGKIFGVTSSSPKEGKSTTISNLAITIAQGGQKVLLVDCDLRRPVIHAVFGYNKEPGITNYLVSRATVDDITRSSPIRNLDIITSGTIPPNPSELVGTRRMREFMDNMRKKYDVILFDTPPIIAVTDAQVIATLVDGMILICSSGLTQIELAQRSREAVEKVDGKILGFVLNNFNISNSYGSYYKYYRYYNYYYESKNAPLPKRSIVQAIIERFTGQKV